MWYLVFPVRNAWSLESFCDHWSEFRTINKQKTCGFTWVFSVSGNQETPHTNYTNLSTELSTHQANLLPESFPAMTKGVIHLIFNSCSDWKRKQKQKQKNKQKTCGFTWVFSVSGNQETPHTNYTNLSTELSTHQANLLPESFPAMTKGVIHLIFNSCSDWNRLRNRLLLP